MLVYQLFDNLHLCLSFHNKITGKGAKCQMVERHIPKDFEHLKKLNAP